MLLTELMKVRNDIEHNDSPPPELQTCQMYIDVVWYFLKSTDQLLDMVIGEVVYEDTEANSGLTLEFQISGAWKVKAEGVVQPKLLRKLASEADLEILDFELSSRTTNQAVRFNGTINLAPSTHRRLAHDYFGVQGYAHEDSGA